MNEAAFSGDDELAWSAQDHQALQSCVLAIIWTSENSSQLFLTRPVSTRLIVFFVPSSGLQNLYDAGRIVHQLVVQVSLLRCGGASRVEAGSRAHDVESVAGLAWVHPKLVR